MAILLSAKVCFLAILVKEKLNFGNSCAETHNFGDFGVREGENLVIFVLKRPTHGTFDVEFSLAKGIILQKVV